VRPDLELLPRVLACPPEESLPAGGEPARRRRACPPKESLPAGGEPARRRREPAPRRRACPPKESLPAGGELARRRRACPPREGGIDVRGADHAEPLDRRRQGVGAPHGCTQERERTPPRPLTPRPPRGTHVRRRRTPVRRRRRPARRRRGSPVTAGVRASFAALPHPSPAARETCPP